MLLGYSLKTYDLSVFRWFKVFCGWRTILLTFCASPFFGSFSLVSYRAI